MGQREVLTVHAFSVLSCLASNKFNRTERLVPASVNEKQKDDPSFGVQHTSFFFSFLFSVPKDRKFKGSVAGSVVSKKKGSSIESIPFFFWTKMLCN